MTEPRLPRSGDVLHLTRAASVQFVKPVVLRVIRVHDWPTYDGWTWVDGYVLDRRGDAIARRSLFVMSAGLRWLNEPLGNQSAVPRSRARTG
ncbi:hypothetical protein [Micromonospora sp. RTGN7]|uniref:hypothetical protein n=1 Tax=Micromonospora sp. RTGN7 TaxID=3016526 RepID=UPI0029FEE8FE|nr:hypothetical protein [Micromonospora sp. RTGN7]